MTSVPDTTARPATPTGRPNHRPFTLVLAGGGARGLAHAGALHALRHAGYRPTALVGVSMGAIVAAAYALNPAWYDDLLALDAPRLPALDPPPQRDLADRIHAVMTAERLTRTLLLGWGPGERQQARVLAALTHLTRGRDLEAATPPVTIVATDLRNGRPVALRRGPAAQAAYASAALAGLLPPLPWHGHLLADGGYADLAPVELARRQHGHAVIALDPYQAPPARDPRNGLETLLRAMEICHHRHAELRLAAADLVLRPTFPDAIDILDFTQARVAIAAGALAVRAALPDLRRLLREPETDPHDPNLSLRHPPHAPPDERTQA